MYERFTDRARKVMQLANQEAQRFNHEYIGTEHILLGLAREGSGVAANVLKNLDVDLRKMRLEVEKLVQSGPDMVTVGKLPQTPRAKKVIEYSMEEARNLSHNYVGTEHILLGLLREQEGVTAQVLMNLGLKLEEFREEVLTAHTEGRRKVAPWLKLEEFREEVLNPLGHGRSPHWRRWITPLALLLIACLLFALRPSLDSVGHKVIGYRLPEVRLEGLTGSDRSIRSEDLAGSVVLMNFWATWCGPCRIELPHLAKLEKKFSSRKDFQFLAVSGVRAESADELAALRQATTEFLEQLGLDIPTYADPDDATYARFCELARSLEPSTREGVPTTIVLDREGIIRGVWIGYAPGVEDLVEETVSQLLDGDGG